MSSRARAGPNHLAGETSPYLLQHLYNPVDWRPWGTAALELARRLDRPIFLSIGYAACHWCHVMERESFENDSVARVLNEHFVPIKVDREERPDVDEIYMNAVQLMTGHGGWPLTLLLTPTLEPFFGGTYLPPDDQGDRTGLLSLLALARDAWGERRDEIERSAGAMAERLREVATGAAGAPAAAPIGRAETARALADLAARFDPRWGGFGGAPKFPPDGALALLLREHERSGEALPLRIVLRTLDAMALGGLYDHVGGGFARYSVDERWLVPHFEKMLYNQALLVPLYVDAFRLTGQPSYRSAAEATLDFVRRELQDPAGGFHSSLDADSDGQEGAFYVWRPEEVEAALGPADGRWFCDLYGITPSGNFEGASIPNLLGGSLAERARQLGDEEPALVARLAPVMARLLAARGRRTRPATDDKVLTGWNGLMISAYARAHALLGRDSDLASARGAAEFLTRRLANGPDRLYASCRAGRSTLNAYLDDYAFAGRGLVDLYEAGFDPRVLDAAEHLADTIVAHFTDGDGGLYFTSDDHEELIVRSRSTHDSALPAGAGVAAELLLRLALHRDRPDLRQAAERVLRATANAVERMPSVHTSLLMAAEWREDPPPEVAIVGPDGDPDRARLVRAVRRTCGARVVLQVGSGSSRSPRRLAVLDGKEALGGRATAYVCRDYACRAPVTDPEALVQELSSG